MKLYYNNYVYIISLISLLSVLTPSLSANWQDEMTCGTRPARQPKIINGSTAEHGNYPWIVSLQLNNRHHCGGSLIRPNWVLTAAHCVYRQNANRFKVKLGGHKRNVTAEPTSIEVNVTKIVAHTGFSYATFADDVALIKLPYNINYTNYIRPICLPEANKLSAEPTVATVAGWGKLRQGGLSAEILQELDLPVVENTLCQSWYRQMGKMLTVRPTQICAGVEKGGKDACQGDSGSPLMVNDPVTKRSRVIGIVSAGIGCALPKLPGLYTRVTSYMDWIEKMIQSNENDVTPAAPVTTAKPSTISTIIKIATTSPTIPPPTIAINSTSNSVSNVTPSTIQSTTTSPTKTTKTIIVGGGTIIIGR